MGFFSYELYLVWILPIHLFNCINMFTHLSLELRLCDAVTVTAMRWVTHVLPLLPEHTLNYPSLLWFLWPLPRSIPHSFSQQNRCWLYHIRDSHPWMVPVLSRSTAIRSNSPLKFQWCLAIWTHGVYVYLTSPCPVFFYSCRQWKKSLFKSLLSYTGITKLFPGQNLWIQIQLLYP